MRDKIESIALQYNLTDAEASQLTDELLDLFSVSNSALIDYIENDAEIAMPINALMHEDGRHLTKKEYGKVILKYLVKELKQHYC